MRKHLLFAAMALLFVSCHESLEDQACREAKEFTEKNCPVKVDEGIINDSMTYEQETKTIHYYYTLNGVLDTTALNKDNITTGLRQVVKNSTSLKKYKENGFNFTYTYFSTKHKGQVLYETTITPKEYSTSIGR